jgi:WD40 repeat protein
MNRRANHLMNCLGDVLIPDLCTIIMEYAKEIRGSRIWGEILSSAQVVSLTQLAGGGLAAGLENGNIWVYRDDLGFDQCLEGHTDSVRALIHMRDGRLASCSYDKTVRIWHLDSAQRNEPPVICTGHTSHVTSLAELPYGVLASGSIDGTIRLWKGAACQVIDTHPVLSLCALSDGSLASGSYHDTRFMFGKHADIYPSGGSLGIVELPSGKLAIRTLLGTIFIWNMITRVREKELSVDGCGVRSLSVLPDGNLAAGYHDYMRVWDAVNGVCLRTIPTGHAVRALTELTRGRFASGGPELHVWS